MKGESSLDAVIFYSSDDQSRASELVKELKDADLRVWFASEDLELGESNLSGITEALEKSRFALICIGAAGFGPYQKKEWGAAFNAEVKGKIRVIPVYLPDAAKPGDQADAFLSDKNGVDLRSGIAGNPLRLRLIRELKDGRPVADGSGRPPTTAAQTTQVSKAANAEASNQTEFVETLVRTLDFSGLTAFVGSSWPERGNRVVPDWQEIAVEILQELQVVGGKKNHGASTLEPLLSADLAAYLLGLREGNFETEAERIMQHYVTPRSLGEPGAYEELVRLLEMICDRTDTRDGTAAAVEITTNVDNGLERAFLKRRVPFTRVVYNRQSGDFLRVDFKQIQEVPNQRAGLSTETGDFVERSEDAWTGDERKRFQKVFQLVKPYIEWKQFVRLLELNRLVREYFRHAVNERTEARDTSGTASAPAREAAKFDLPVLLKLHGAYDLKSTSVVSIPHYYQLIQNANRLPAPIQSAITQNASLFMGYNMTEPAFIQLYETCLRSPFKQEMQKERYALMQVPSNPRSGKDRIDRAVWFKLATLRRQNALRITPLLNVDPIAFIKELRQGLEKKENDAVGAW